MKTLIDSSFETREWVHQIRDRIAEERLPARYQEATYWARFESEVTGRNFAYLHPQKGQIRLFLAVLPSFDRALRKSPSTKHWEWVMPSLYVIRGPHVFAFAAKFIQASYEIDRTLSEMRRP